MQNRQIDHWLAISDREVMDMYMSARGLMFQELPKGEWPKHPSALRYFMHMVLLIQLTTVRRAIGEGRIPADAATKVVRSGRKRTSMTIEGG